MREKRASFVGLSFKAIQNVFGKCIIITEDIDFYEPRFKLVNGRTRMKTITCCRGKVAKHLLKTESICVHCIYSYTTAFCAVN